MKKFDVSDHIGKIMILITIAAVAVVTLLFHNAFGKLGEAIDIAESEGEQACIEFCAPDLHWYNSTGGCNESCECRESEGSGLTDIESEVE